MYSSRDLRPEHIEVQRGRSCPFGLAGTLYNMAVQPGGGSRASRRPALDSE